MNGINPAKESISYWLLKKNNSRNNNSYTGCN